MGTQSSCATGSDFLKVASNSAFVLKTPLTVTPSLGGVTGKYLTTKFA